MSGATFSRVKVWINEIVLTADLNAEFDNILSNLKPSGIDGAQATLTQMRTTLAPNESGLATSLLSEIQELRYMLQQLAGGNSTYWYSTPTTSLTDLKNAIGGALVNNRLVSGAVSTTSSAPRFLAPGGSSNQITVKATTTSLVYVINGTSYTLAADTTVATLSLGAGTTCTVNDSSLAGAEATKTLGEDGTVIPVSALPTGASVGGTYAFKVVHSAVTEYFIGTAMSSTTLGNCFRGFFVDSSRTEISRVALSNGDTITLCKLTWLYLGSTGVLTPSYVNPTFSATAPTSPNTGDYWFDMTAGQWKTYGGVSWAATTSILIGVCVQDSTNCVGARAFNYYTSSDSYSNLNLQWVSNTTIQQLTFDGRVAVNGNNAAYVYTRPIWDLAVNLESGQTRTTTTTYYAYVNEYGLQYLSTKKPYDMRGTLKGWYHPSENWRAIAKIKTNATGSGNFDPQTLVELDPVPTNNVLTTSSIVGLNPKTVSNIGLKASVAASAMTVTLTQADGVTAPNQYNPVIVPFRGSTITTFSFIPRYITSTLAITVPSTATLGMTSAVAAYVWVYLIDDAGTIDIGVSFGNPLDENSVASTAAIVGAANTVGTLYSVSAHTSCAIRLIGRLSVTEATAGTWATAPSQIDVMPQPIFNRTEPVAYTASFAPGFGTVGGQQTYSWRDGKFLEVRSAVTIGNVAASVAQINIGYNGSNLPANILIDTTVAANVVIGSYANNNASGWGNMLTINTNTNTVAYGPPNGSVTAGTTNANGSAIAANSGLVTCWFKVIIAGWYSYGA